jgi:hypothetical protein
MMWFVTDVECRRRLYFRCLWPYSSALQDNCTVINEGEKVSRSSTPCCKP